jgi:capsular polysaccharide biosynthesis protein
LHNNNSQLNGNRHMVPAGPGMGSGAALGGGKEHQGEHILSLKDFVRTIRRRLWVIVIVAGMLAALAGGLSLLQTPTYQATAKMLVGQERGSYQTYNLNNEVAGIQQITKTVVEAIKTRPVAEEVVQRLGSSVSVGTLLENLEVKQIGDTEFVEVSYQDADPERAQLVANTVGDVFAEQLAETNLSANTVTASIWEAAVVPASPVSPVPVRNMLLALALGLMLGVGLAFLLEHMDDKSRSPEEVEQVSGVPNLGVIPTFEKSKKTEREISS